MEGEGDRILYMIHGTLWPKSCPEKERRYARDSLHLLEPRQQGKPQYCESEETALPQDAYIKVEAKSTGENDSRPSAQDTQDLRRKAALYEYPFTF